MQQGEVVTTRLGESWRVGRLLGEGGQGRVVEISSLEREGRRAALKWYAPRTYQPWQQDAIRYLVQRGSPGSMFLWPQDTVSGEDGSFGYTMPLIPEHYVGLSRVLRGEAEIRPSMALRLAIGLTHGFLQLHSQGLCYRDISFGNVLVDVSTAAVLICDNDNVGVDGISPTAVWGTRRFMAPEVVRGEVKPSIQTDLHALAVLIFSVLMVQHPLIGRRELDHPCVDEDVERLLCGDDPLFIFDPEDPSNAPDPLEHPGVSANWALHPPGVRRLFTEAFGVGLHQPHRRVRESVWRSELATALDEIATCGDCGRESFMTAQVVPCWNCSGEITDPPCLVFPRSRLILREGGQVYRHHLERDYDVVEVVASVVKHPRQDRWGLRNDGRRPWTVRTSTGEVTVGPAQTVALIEGARVDFGAVSAEISG